MTAGITIAVRVKPGAPRTRVGGCHEGPWGPALVVAVNAPAVDGRATDAARVALARALGVRRSELDLRQGARSRDKLFAVETAAPERLAAAVRALRGEGP